MLATPVREAALTFREFLADRGLSINGFARQMSEADNDTSHTNFERWRQNAYRWTRGSAISPDKAERVAYILDVPVEEVLATSPPRQVDASVMREIEMLRTEVERSNELLRDLMTTIRELPQPPPEDQPPGG